MDWYQSEKAGRLVPQELAEVVKAIGGKLASLLSSPYLVDWCLGS